MKNQLIRTVIKYVLSALLGAGGAVALSSDTLEAISAVCTAITPAE